MKDERDAEEVLTNGFMKIFENISKYKGEGSFEGWIRRTMINTALDELRKRNRMQMDADISEAEYLAGEGEMSTSDLRVEEMMKIIQAMPTGYRTVFNMYAIEGYSHQEIADELGVSESTSKTQYRKARTYLMNIIVERENI